MAEEQIINNSKDIYDILDTSVKIGLGALIGSITSLIAIKTNHKNSISKEKITKKMQLIEELTIVSEEFFTAYIGIFNFLQGIKYSTQTEKEFYKLLKQNKSECTIKENNYEKGIETSSIIRAKLYLIGLPDLEKKLLQIDTLVSPIINSILIENVIPDKEIFDTNALLIVKTKKDYFSEIKNCFDRLN